MRSLLNFLLRYKTLILFLILEGVALFMLSSSHNYHQSVTSSAARSVFGGITKRVEKGRSYFRLRQINKLLIAENRMLQEKLTNLDSGPETSFKDITDTVTGQSYNYLNARVVNNSVNKQKNFITLDKGQRNGVGNGMAVASADGVIGVVVGTSQNYAVAMSLLNIDFRLSARIANNNYFGSLAWDGRNHRFAQLSEIPHHVVVNSGDTIVTSGYSAIFPAGLVVGTLTGDQNKGGDFITLKVKLSADFKNLTNVYIIGNLHRDERKRLEEEVMNE